MLGVTNRLIMCRIKSLNNMYKFDSCRRGGMELAGAIDRHAYARESLHAVTERIAFRPKNMKY